MKKIILLLAIAFSVVACNKDESDFSGGDNFIIGFNLTVGGITYTGAVAGDQIIVSVPEGLSLRGAVANVTLSENAAISPDPTQVTDWDSEAQFIVTAHNNQRKSYIYRIDRTSVSKSGNVVLTTQAEVDAFAETGISIIDGNLTIGNMSAVADTISNLAALGSLRQVVHNITILNTYKGENLAGLDHLEKIGGLNFTTTATQSAATLLEIDLPQLTTVGTSLNVSSTTLKTLSMPELAFVGDVLNVKSDAFSTLHLGELVSVGGNMTLNAAASNTMETVSLPKLETVGGTFTMTQWPSASVIELPVLKSVSGLVTLTYWNKMTAVSLPELETAGGLTLNYMTAVTGINMPALKTLNGTVALTLPGVTSLFMNSVEEITGNLTLTLAKATGATFSQLKSVGGTLNIPSGAINLTVPYFPALKYIGVDLQIQNKAITDFTGFPVLEEIGKRLYLYNATSITSISELASLKKIGTVLYLYGITNLTELDIRSIDIQSIEVYLTTYVGGFTIIGDEVFGGTIKLGAMPNGTGMELPTIQGIKKYGGLTFDLGSYYTGNIEMAGVEEVTGELLISWCNAAKEVIFPDLKRTGKFTFTSGCYGMRRLVLSKLTEITGDFTYPVVYSASYGGPLAEVSLPKLETVGGNFSMTGITVQQTISGLDMPLLKTIGGTLTLSGTSNTNFTNVGNFSNLTSAAGVTISGFTKLVDFASFAGVVPTLDATTWKVSNSGYNPTYQDMLDGKYVKP